MLRSITQSPQLLSAEWLKLKKTPAFYLVITGALFTATMVFVGYFLDVHNMVRLNINPWKLCFDAGLSIFNVFLLVPFLVLLLSAATYVEQRANAWKYLYTLPYRRGQFFFAKLVIILFFLALILFFAMLSLVVSGYLIDLFRPTYEFRYYTPDWGHIISNSTHLFIAALGLVGWQYLLCLRSKNFLLPLGIGILGFITSIILSVTSSSFAIYSPYAYPILVKDVKMFHNASLIEDHFWGLSNIELYSLIWFVLCVGLAYGYEIRRNVDQ